MAILNGRVLGDPTGICGGVSFREFNKKLVMSKRPENIKKSVTELAIASRARVTPMSKFASVVCSFSELKSIWKEANNIKAMSAYHKVEKANKGRFEPLRPTASCVIVPGSGATIQKIYEELNANLVRIVVQTGKDFSDNHEGMAKVSAIMIVCFYDPVEKGEEYFSFCPIRKNFEGWKIDEPAEVKYVWEQEGRDIYSLYRKSILYYTVIAYDADGETMGYSTSESREYENDDVVDFDNKSGIDEHSADILAIDFLV